MATGIDVLVAGKRVKGIFDYSVDEESTPVDIGDTTGAAGKFTVTFAAITAAVAKRMRRKTVNLADQGQGSTAGIGRVPSRGADGITLSSDLRTTLLSVQRTAQPYSGTLGGYFIYCLGLVGITTGYVIDSSLNSLPVVFPGWQGEVWLQLKKMIATKKAEISLVSDLIVLRPVRGRITVDKRDLDYSWTVDDTQLALSVAGYYYNNTQITNGLAYPKGGWNSDVQIYQVDAGETLEFDIPIEASLSSVVQPVAADFIGRYDVGASAYCVMGNDGLPITAAQWNAAGGKITVAIGADTKSLVVTIVGADIAQYAPFRIAATAGPSDNYSSLRLLGTGVFFTKTLVTLPTSVPTDLASQAIGQTVDNEFVNTFTDLLDGLIWTLARFGGSRQSINVSTTGVNRTGDAGSYAFPTIRDFNAQEVALGHGSIAMFNSYATAQGWTTIKKFNDAEYATVATAFTNQAFGNVAGARTKRDNIFWRIRTAKIAPGKISYSAEADTTCGDFDNTWTAQNNSGNLYPYYGFEDGSNLIADTGVTASNSTDVFTGLVGTKSSKGVATSTAVASVVSSTTQRAVVVAGKSYDLGVWVYNGASGSRSFDVRLQCFVGTGSTVITSAATTVTLAAGELKYVKVLGTTIGATATRAGINVRRNAGGGAAASDKFYVEGGTIISSATPVSLISDFNTEQAGRTISDFNVAPLERAA